MKKNFLITTGIKDTFESYENNFLLGKWCELDFFGKEKLDKKISKEINTIKNTQYYENNEKKIKDYDYIKKNLEYLLELLSEKLSNIHNVNENKEYWRIIIFNWMSEYLTVIFFRWESVKIFFEKNSSEKFYSNFISLNDSDYIQEDHEKLIKFAQKDKWNHLIFLRLFKFLNMSNLSLIKKQVNVNNLKQELSYETKKIFYSPIIKVIDLIISKFAFKFNKIIFAGFYFPKKEYIKMCFRCKLIPSKYFNFFDFKIEKSTLSKDDNDKRIKLKNLLAKTENQDQFIQFILLNIHNDMPKSYLENFNEIKKKILPIAKEKKIIFSMYSLERNDNFKIYIAETKKWVRNIFM